MTETVWKVPGIYKQDPAEVAEELRSLGDKCSLHDVVENARDESSVMHDMFEWDDSIAGEKYRESQAANIVRLLVYVDREKPEREPVRVFQSTMERTREYTPTVLVIQNEDKYQSLLRQARADLEAFKRKYHTLVEYEEIIKLIDELI